MKIIVIESTMVFPAEKTPKEKLWLSNIDLVTPNYHASSVYFYRPNGSANFFNTNVMKDALRRALVAFYPVAGRFEKDENGRVMIDCQGQGVLFVEAQGDGVVDDYGDFRPSLELRKLVPMVDYSQGIEAFPLCGVQVTYFKCGGVSLATALHHGVADGLSGLHFFNTWSDMVRGFDITLSPFLDRTLLSARDPPQASFEHIEYQPTLIPSPLLEPPSDGTLISVFKVTRDQLDILKRNSKNKYSSFEMLTGHVWKCVCKAREPFDDTKTKLFIATDGRDRLQPPLPPGYFGNAIFMTTPSAISCEIQSNPSSYAASVIHDALSKVNNDYLKSAVDYLELLPDLKILVRGPNTFKSSNIAITSWTRIPIYRADFGWGQPIYMGPPWIPYEGCIFMLPSPIYDGSISIVIKLQSEHMKRFSKFFYDDMQ